MASSGEGTVLLPQPEQGQQERPLDEDKWDKEYLAEVAPTTKPTPRKPHPTWKPPAVQLTKLDGNVPLLADTGSFYPDVLHPFDKIMIAGVDIPVVASSVHAGTVLEVDKHKPHGADFPTVIGKGYDAEHTKFTILLYKDLLHNVNWLTEYYNKVKDSLLPRELSNRTAVDVYHPFLAAEGITQLVIIRRGLPVLSGHQIWHVEIEGIDTRFAQFKSQATKSKSRVMISDPSVNVNTVLGVPRSPEGVMPNGPAANQAGKP